MIRKQQSEKATYQMGESIHRSYIWQGLSSKIYKEIMQLSSKNQIIWLKVG